MLNRKDIYSVLYIALIISGLSPLQGQVSSALELIIRHNPPMSHTEVQSAPASNILQISRPGELVRLGIDFYQYFISSQDIPACLFTPSCSHFAEQALTRFGIIKGLLLTSDRLQRCHTFSDKGKIYEFDFELKHYKDPVWHYGSRK